MITALADSIQILPTGACLDFANGEKGLVLADNPADFLHPMILNFKDNRIYDLSDPETSDQLQIVDIMKTMDNRIAIDSDTLKHLLQIHILKRPLTVSVPRKKKSAVAKMEHLPFRTQNSRLWTNLSCLRHQFQPYPLLPEMR